MVTPDHFRVEYVINPHMEGHIGTVDRPLAREQWDALRATYERLGVDVAVLAGGVGLPDMVFCANQTLPFRAADGTPGVVLSRMHAPQRADEVALVADFFEREGYTLHTLPGTVPGSFEGMGDALWHPGRRRLWVGHGFRTDRAAVGAVAEITGAETTALALVDPDFYHLDTCLCPLDERTALYYPPAFDDAGRAALADGFERLIEVPEDDARERFACNAHSPDGQHVILERGNEATVARLREAGFEPVEVDTSEFLKSGGSVFCMKLMFW